MRCIETHIAEKQEIPIRFQEYAVGIFKTIPTKSGIKKAIKKNLILINNEPASTSKYILGGEKIVLKENKKSTDFSKLKLDLKVLYEDDFLAVIYKPAGMLVSGNKFVTITNALTQNLKKSSQEDAVIPKPTHRLDYPTSGLLLVGKTIFAITSLSKMFENREILKTYHAITIGKMPRIGLIETPIDTKKAKTFFNVLQTVKSKRFIFLNLVELKPETGRKHQIRKHLWINGNPILGDKLYFKENLILKGNGLFLNASKIEFKHPITNEILKISFRLPKKFLKIFPEK